MNYYLDITLLPDSEISLGFIWHKLYQQIHIMLAEHKVGKNDSEIGLSFPQYSRNGLGKKLRLLAKTEDQLKALDVEKWLDRLNDYVHLKQIKPVPANITQFACFKRRQFKSPHKLLANVDKRAEFLANKNNYRIEDVKQRLIANISQYDLKYHLPYINVSSLSTNKDGNPELAKDFKLFIEREMKDNPTANERYFTCYGLSRRETHAEREVPLFD